MIKKLLRNYYIKNTIIIAMALLLLLSSMIGAYISYSQCKETFYKHIDKVLKSTALNLDLLFLEDFHNRAINKGDINSTEDMRNIYMLSKFANNLEDVEYVYTLTQQQDGKVYFTSSSMTDEEFEENNFVAYFDYYDEATELLQNVLRNNKIVYEEASDKWGTFRTVFIPKTTKSGTKYILGVDVKIDYINKILNEYLASTIISFVVILIILMGLGLYFWRISRRELQEIGELKANLEQEIEDRTCDLSLANKVIEKSHQNIQDSIKFASLIQKALLPDKIIADRYVQELFIFWKPKDTVGGDIYFMSELDSGNEIIIMVIDGAGHGVPGAFVTMLVKAIETQIIGEIRAGHLKPSPANILEYFNQAIKIMLKQEKGSQSNAGFDGGILYFNKEKNICKYAGAKTPLYIIKDGNLEILKSDRKNVGFVRTKINQKYTEYDIKIEKGTQLYLCTDGIIDQEGKNDSRYGKARFESLILSNSKKSFSEQKFDIISDFEYFQSDFKQSDDITVLGLRF